jgi:hypothetical protein
MRELIRRGQSRDRRAIDQEVGRIAALNVGKYQSLSSNTNYIRSDWRLKISDDKGQATAPPTTETKDHKKDQPAVTPDPTKDRHSTASTEKLQQGHSTVVQPVKPTLEQKHDRSVPHAQTEHHQHTAAPHESNTHRSASESNRQGANDQHESSHKVYSFHEDAQPGCPVQPWKEAEPGKMIVVNQCERYLAPPNSWLIVQPGGEAILNPGSRAFLAPRGKIDKALPGSLVIAEGGTVVDYGAKILVREPGVKVLKPDINPYLPPPQQEASAKDPDNPGLDLPLF